MRSLPELVRRPQALAIVVLVGVFAIFEVVLGSLADGDILTNQTADGLKLVVVVLLAIPGTIAVRTAFHARALRVSLYVSMGLIVMYCAVDAGDELAQLHWLPVFAPDHMAHKFLTNLLSTGTASALFVGAFLLLFSFDSMQRGLAAAELERKKTEADLRQSQATQMALWDGTPDLIFRLSRDGTIVDYHASEANVLKHPRGFFVGRKFSELFPEAVWNAARQAIRTAVQTNAVQSFEYTLEVSHKERHFHARISRIGADEVICVARDLTELKTAEQQRLTLEARMREVQRLDSLSELAGGIAHDFNNLLTTVMGNATLALDTLDQDSDAREYLRKIEQASHCAAELSHQMLAYSGKGRFAVEPIDLSELVQATVDLLRVSIPKSVKLHLQLTRPLPQIEGDVAQVRQVVLNLVTNAAEAIEESGDVTVKTGVTIADRDDLAATFIDDHLPAGPYVYLEVCDSGAGMDEPTVRRVFEPFFSTKFAGRGLGLATVFGVVRGHRGAITVESKPGRGTTFATLFPATANRDPRPLQDEKDVPHTWSGQGTVLAADDEAVVLATIQKSLERDGFRVLTATDRRDVIRVFEAHADEITAVLLDLTMPYLSAEETVRRILEIRHVPIVVMSGYSEQEVESFRHNLAGYLQKPFGPGSLRQVFKNALSATSAN